MGKIYYLDLNTLLAYLQNKSGTLTTSLQVSGQPCAGSISFANGQITTCIVEWSNGRRLEGDEAFKLLRAGNAWQIHFTDTLNPQSATKKLQPNISAPINTSYLPQPQKPLTPTLLAHYNLQQRIILRMVHSLVDGQHTIGQIKTQLNLPAETVDTALSVLHQLETIR